MKELDVDVIWASWTITDKFRVIFLTICYHLKYMNLGIVLVIICLLNLPFGYWRVNVRRFSFQWILAVHLPIPLVIIVRILGGVGWHIKTFPLLAVAYFAGQYLGGSLYTQWKKRN